MSSWVYVVSQFTPEALLFEALVICLLIAAYTAYWILRRRRLGVAEEGLPTGAIKGYLGELIGDAEEMRAQLFGLINSQGRAAPAQYAGSPIPAGSIAVQNLVATPAADGQSASPVMMDAAMIQKLAALEAKMAEQAKMVEGLISDKSKLEQELTAARAATAAAASGDSSSALTEMQNRINGLEAKLAEYSVIEDDLANLKRLQQENTQLRAAMGGGAAAALAAAQPAPVAQAAAPATQPAPVAQAAAPAPAEPQPLDPLPIEEAAAAPAGDAAFEGLVDQVETSISGTPAAAAQPAAPDSKSDADLVAEFEKMLNG